jgi:lysyl-tRNA synthetase class 2
MNSESDFEPTASLVMLRRRSEIIKRLRTFFGDRGYWEVQTPLLSRDCCVDAWLEPFAVPLDEGDIAYLQTSPEFALKRLLCQGADRIFEVAHAFRKEEQGSLHNPEFCMVEWYERNQNHLGQMMFVEDLVRTLATFCAQQGWLDSKAATLPAFQRITYENSFREVLGVSPAMAETAELISIAQARAGAVPAGMQADRDGLLNLLLAECVEPWLKAQRAVFLYDYPETQAALAKISAGDPRVAERFELYLDGIEICNGYHELTDAAELRKRMHAQNAKRAEAGKTQLPVESRLLHAMERGLPASSGVALGFDRLAMWCLGCRRIEEVMPFPFDRA